MDLEPPDAEERAACTVAAYFCHLSEVGNVGMDESIHLTPKSTIRARRNLQMSVFTVWFRTTSQRVRAVTEHDPAPHARTVVGRYLA